MLKRVKRYTDEFKTFAMRGNVIDMAVGIIIGASFGKIVDSLVKDIIMPPLGWGLGRVDFSNLFIPLSISEAPIRTLDEAQAAGIVTINYGLFLNTVISFMLVAFSVFLLIKLINKLQINRKEETELTTKQCPFCCSTININAKKCPNCTSNLD